MNEKLDFYIKQAQSALSNIPWIAEIQSQALEELAARGFPVRQDEDWKYTNIAPWLETTFTEKKVSSEVREEINTISIINGNLYISQLALPEGVIVLPLSKAFNEHADKIKPHFLTENAHDQGFHALNTAFLNTGIFIYVPAGIHIETPLVLSHHQDQNEGAHYLRHIIIAEEKSEFTLVEKYSGNPNCTYFTNTVTDIRLGSEAKLTHYKIQNESKSAFHIGLIQAYQATKSEFNSHSLSVGGKLVRSDIRINFEGEYAKCLMNGIYIPAEGQHVDHHTSVLHAFPNCASKQDYKGILFGQSRAVFNGKVMVLKDAQHTEAKQYNKNLLLSANAEIDTKPQLEIYADDVTCAHGATVGQLEEDALFYMATRGIGKEEARGYLVHGFASENLASIPHPHIAQWMKSLISQQLGLEA